MWLKQRHFLFSGVPEANETGNESRAKASVSNWGSKLWCEDHQSADPPVTLPARRYGGGFCTSHPRLCSIRSRVPAALQSLLQLNTPSSISIAYGCYVINCLQVSDSGMGIPENAKDWIFKVFSQGDSSRTKNVQVIFLAARLCCALRVTRLVDQPTVHKTLRCSPKPRCGTALPRRVSV